MTDDFTRLLKAQIDHEVPRRPSPDLAAVLTNGKRRRVLSWIGVSVAAIIATAGVVPAAHYLANSSSIINPARQGNDYQATPQLRGAACPPTKGKARDARWTSPTTRVADGTHEVERWILCARTVAKISVPSNEGLCMNWLRGAPSSGGMDCVFLSSTGNPVPLDADYFLPIIGTDSGLFYGAAPAVAHSVELETSNGDVIEGKVYPAPEQLRVPFRFFTLFAEPNARGTLIVRDEHGEIIEERRTARPSSDDGW